MKNVFQETAIETAADIKHVLADLLSCLVTYLRALDYHGNINPQSMTAVPTISNEDQKKKVESKKVCFL
jgi:hypothetical protein